MKSCGNPFLRTGLVLSAALFCTTGCKTMSGWKLPFTGREPDADKLAARADTITPTSPASKHSPSAIASAAANPPKSTMTPATGSSPTSTASYPGSTSGLLGNSSTPSYTPSNPSGGLAATANGYTGTAGYQTGPYNTSNKSGTPGSFTSSGLPNSGGANPYGASTYTGVTSTTAPNITNNGQLPTTNQPPANSLGGMGASEVRTLESSSLDFPAIPGGYTSPSTPNYPGYGNVSSATANGSSSQVGSTAQTGTLPAVSAYQSATPASAYAPGTTGRAISNYNFSPGATSNASNGTPNSTTPPANYGGQTQSQSFSLPPNTASGEPLLVR